VALGLPTPTSAAFFIAELGLGVPRGGIVGDAGDIINIIMRQTKNWRLRELFFLGILGLVVHVESSGLMIAQSADLTSGNIVIRGSLVCLNTEGRETPCTEGEHPFGLKDGRGKVYPLKTDKSLDTLRTEPRMQSKDFQLTLRPIQNSSLYEIIKSRFFRDGKLYDFYYYCDVCNITTYHPGLCMCCRQETEYRENMVH
jgi:hypothetical protein